jgi:hypothetical protein
MAEERFVTRLELNGSLLRIERKLDDGFANVYTKIDERIDREVDKREDCAAEHDKAIAALEKCVGAHDQKLKLPGWVWKGVAAVLGLGVVVLDIILAVKVLAH